MMLTRRTLFKSTAVGVAVAAVPGKLAAAKMVAPAVSVGANTMITPTMVAREALAQLNENNLVVARLYREYKAEDGD